MAFRPKYPPMIPPGPIKLTYEDYAELPNDRNRYQILDGRLDVTPAPSTWHQWYSQNLEHILIRELQQKGVGVVLHAPIDVLLGTHDIVQPDICFVRTKRLDIVEEKYIKGAPGLIIEVLSPSTARTDRTTKSRIYARYGIPSYWMVNGEEQRIDFYRLEDSAYVLAAQVSRPGVAEPEELEGLRIDLDEVFRLPG
jgi:Uma2 family endonuclease